MHDNFINLIFGMKVRQARTEAGLSLTQFAELADLSASYVTEIEKGRKYPRTDKIVRMAEVLDKSYDEMVSIQLAPGLKPIETALRSPLLQHFPFEEFGLEMADLVTLLTRSPEKGAALLQAIGEIGRLYAVNQEHILLAVLRAHQELNENYFPELEEAAVRFADQYGLETAEPQPLARYQELIQTVFGYSLETTLLGQDPTLGRYRSVYIHQPRPRLLINDRLRPRQIKFLLAREMGYHFLGLTERSETSSPDRVDSFQQVFNDFQASYFAGALLMPRPALLADLEALLGVSRWEPARLLAMLPRYDVTPEMLLYRITELVPQFFGLSLHFFRFHQIGERYRLIKQLNMNRLLLPLNVGALEHNCRRWLALRLLRELGRLEAKFDQPHAGAQVSEFMNSGHQYLCLGLARPLTLQPGINSSVVVGFRVDANLRGVVGFLDDPALPRALVHETCQRCPLTPTECSLRAAPPQIWEAEQTRQARRQALRRLLAQVQS